MEKERLRFTIERYDHYYDSVNNKSNIVLGFSTIIFGSLITVYPILVKKVIFTSSMHLLLAGACSLGFASVMTLLITSIPHLKSNGKSIHFFNSVAGMGKSKFAKKSLELTEEDELSDLRKQTFYLADGLSKKFKRLRLAILLIILQMIVLVPYITLILTHLKQ